MSPPSTASARSVSRRLASATGTCWRSPGVETSAQGSVGTGTHRACRKKSCWFEVPPASRCSVSYDRRGGCPASATTLDPAFIAGPSRAAERAAPPRPSAAVEAQLPMPSAGRPFRDAGPAATGACAGPRFTSK